MIRRAAALIVLSLPTVPLDAAVAPAMAQVLLPPADVPARRPVQPRPLEEPPSSVLAPTVPQPAQPAPRGSFERPVERQALPPPPDIMAPPQPAQPQRPQGARPVPQPGIQTPTPPSPAGTVPPGSDDFVVVAPPAQRIENRTAVFNGLDKITGRIIVFDVSIGETVQFGALQVTPRACYTRPPNETPNTTGFLEVDEITLQSEIRRIFTGWMFASSPGLHAIEHSIYDIWLVDCKQTPPNLEAQTRR